MKTLAHPSFDEEKIYWQENKLVIGIDEVGRGAFAGPIVAAAVVFPKDFSIRENLKYVNDSKQVKPILRRKLSKIIKENALLWSVEEVSVATINRIGIGKANQMVFRKVIANIVKQKKGENAFHLLVDGFHVKYIKEIGLKHQKAIVKGDQISFSIAAASIIAKVHRDKIMKSYSRDFPSYRFAKNKGYGTADHRASLKLFGLTRLHREIFCRGILTSF